MRNISIKKLLIVYTFIAFIIPILIIGIGSTIITTLYLKNNIKETSSSFLNVVDKVINDFIKNCRHSLSSISSLYKKYKKNNFMEFEINENIIKNGNFDTIFILDNSGKIIDIYPNNLNKLIGFDFSNENVIKETIKNKDFSINLIRYSFFNDKPSLLIAVPVIEDDKLIAIVAGIIKFSKLINNVLELKEYCSKINFIITDKSGYIIIHPDREKMEQAETIDYLADLKPNVLNFVSINDEFYFVKYKIIKDMNWVVLTLQDYSFVVLLFRKIFIIFLANLITGIIITVIAILVGISLIIKPIYSISYKTSEVSHGNYNINKEYYFIKEFNSLLINLNKMIKKIAKREEELRISESKYRKLIENSLDFFFKVDKNINLTFVSSSVEVLLGYSSEEFKANFKKIVIKNRMNIVSRRIIKDIFKTKLVPEPFNLELVHKNGYRVVLELQATPIVENEEVIEVQGIARDITSRFYAEKQVIYFKNYLLNLIESMPSALITLDTSGRITNLNSSALKIINKPKEEIIDKILWELDSKFFKYLSYFNYVLENNKKIEFREEDNIDGKERFLNITFFPMKWENSFLIALRIDDVTEIERIQMELREIQKLETIGAIASGLSHDFNNILGAILGTLRVIEERTKDKKSINCSLLNDDLETIKEASKKATHIVQQLMNFSRRQNIKFEILDINSEIKNVINIFKNSLGKKKIDIIFNEAKEPLWIEGNPSLIGEMILNILLNARDAIENNGKIVIKLKKIKDDEIKELIEKPESKDFINIVISDTGKGIPDSIKKKIFTPLFTTKKKGEGTGLGLAMVYNIVKNHKGYITFDSKLNEGTVFNIYIPVADIHEYAEKGKAGISDNKKGILIIDDDQYILYTTEQMLKECGYNIFTANSGENALEILKEKRDEVSAILLDVIMPGLAGKDLVKEIFKINKSYKILLTSGTRNDATIFELENLGIKDFLLKPFTFEELAEAFYNILNKKL